MFCQPSGSVYVVVNETVTFGLDVPEAGVIVPTTGDAAKAGTETVRMDKTAPVRIITLAFNLILPFSIITRWNYLYNTYNKFYANLSYEQTDKTTDNFGHKYVMQLCLGKHNLLV